MTDIVTFISQYPPETAKAIVGEFGNIAGNSKSEKAIQSAINCISNYSAENAIEILHNITLVSYINYINNHTDSEKAVLYIVEEISKAKTTEDAIKISEETMQRMRLEQSTN